jgi:hypothetical protein
MEGARAEVAASSAVICLEALSAIQNDIEEMSHQANIEIDVDIRTAIYTFTGEFKNPKPLSTGLNEIQRLDTYTEILAAEGDSTSNAFLGGINQLPASPERHQVLIVVTDGAFHEDGKIAELRRKGWRVFGLSIQSDAAVEMFAPGGRLINNPAELPQAMTDLIKENF